MKLRWLLRLGLMAALLALAMPLFERLWRTGTGGTSSASTAPAKSKPPANALDAVLRRSADDAQGRARSRTRTQAPPQRDTTSPRKARKHDPEAETHVTVYRWVDRNGTVHYESAPPPDGVRADEVVFRTRRPVGSARAPADAPVARSPAAADDPSALADNPMNVYTPDGFDQLMESLDSTLDRLDRRRSELNELKEAL